MKTQTSVTITRALMALSLIAGTSAFAESPSAETPGSEDPMAEAQALLASPTSLGQALATAEPAAGGKVAGIEYQAGENGGPDLIMADGTEKTVAINPADRKVMNITLAANDQQGGENVESDGENASN